MIRERVRLSSTRIIEDRLHKDDLVVPCGDGFLVVFAQASPEQIAAQSRQISEALIEFFLGEEGLSALRAEVSARQIGSEAMDALLTASEPSLAKPAREKLCAPKTAVDMLPVWSFRQQAPVLDFFTPTLKGKTCGYVGYDPEFLVRGHHRKYDFLDYDLAVLDRAVTAFDSKVHSPGSRMYCIQVHATTMQNRRARDRYLSWLPEPHDPFLDSTILTIAEIARGTPMVSIVDWVSHLRSRFARIILDLHFTDHSIGSVADAGAWAASIHLPVEAAAQRPPQREETLRHVRFWARSMHVRRMRLLVHGFSDPTFYEQCAEIGVDMATMAISAPTAAAAAIA